MDLFSFDWGRARAACKFTGFTGGLVQPGKILDIFQKLSA
jgi:hypothetical protein